MQHAIAAGMKEERPSSRNEADKRRRDWLLDEALKDTFPASDPPSIAMPQN
jgi:hypothetical protein